MPLKMEILPWLACPRPLAQALPRWYPPLIVGLAAFLLALVLWRTPLEGYVAETTVVTGDGPQGEVGGAAIEEWLRSDQVLRAALARSDSRTISARDVRQGLQITSLAQPDEAPRIAIACQADEARLARSLARSLAAELAENYGPQQREMRRREKDRQRDELQSRLRLAQAAEDSSRRELERLRHAQLAMALAGAGTRNPVYPPAAAVANPRWMELKRELETLLARRADMLEFLQPKHPEIEGITLRIARLQVTLDKTPQELPSSQATDITPHRSASRTPQTILEWRRVRPVAADEDSDTSPAAPSRREGLDPLITLAAQIDEAAHQLASASRQRQELESELAASERALADVAGPAHPAWVVQPNQRVTRLGGSPSRRQLGAALLLALVVGGLMAYLRPAPTRRLESLDQLRALLPVPILGSLPVAGGGALSPISAPAMKGTAIRLLTRSCEAFVAGVALACLYAGWMDPSLGGEFWTDPLGALCQTADRVL